MNHRYVLVNSVWTDGSHFQFDSTLPAVFDTNEKIEIENTVSDFDLNDAQFVLSCY